MAILEGAQSIGLTFPNVFQFPHCQDTFIPPQYLVRVLRIPLTRISWQRTGWVTLKFYSTRLMKVKPGSWEYLLTYESVCLCFFPLPQP